MTFPIFTAPGLAKLTFEDKAVAFKRASHGMIVDACACLNAVKQGILGKEPLGQPANGGTANAPTSARIGDPKIERNAADIGIFQIECPDYAGG
ncbi:hypothetical protein [Roseimicrobium sp. ORNL1]|uniref:hypothetical protein n=1 Tax=Roseimicrobium sp. ORNL1 TaxID=2711231 RepID=UPI001F0F7721|nr:hypothetical protein [Roseimicrobium sp. ORNL1]